MSVSRAESRRAYARSLGLSPTGGAEVLVYATLGVITAAGPSGITLRDVRRVLSTGQSRQAAACEALASAGLVVSRGVRPGRVYVAVGDRRPDRLVAAVAAYAAAQAAHTPHV